MWNQSAVNIASGSPVKQHKQQKLGYTRTTYLWERSFGEDYQQAGLQTGDEQLFE